MAAHPRFAVLAAALFALAWVTGAVAQPKFPALTGRIVDQANLLEAADEARLVSVLEALEKESTDQLAVLTLKSLDGYPIEDYGYQLGRAWAIGQKEKNNGAILIVAPNERKVRIEVGRGLESELTDAMSKLIIENAILPAFKRGDFAGGIKAGVGDIRDVLLGNAEAVKARSKRGPDETDWETILLLCFWLAVLAFVIWAQFQDARQMPQSAQGRRARRAGRDDGPIFLPPAGGSGGWGGGSGGGGGWSGGGGDFGGGGGSGSW